MAVIDDVLVRYDDALRCTGRAGGVLQQEGLGRAIDYSSARDSLQAVGGEPLNAEGSQRVFRVGRVTRIVSARWRRSERRVRQHERGLAVQHYRPEACACAFRD